MNNIEKKVLQTINTYGQNPSRPIPESKLPREQQPLSTLRNGIEREI
jgi:hypothetical protein